MSAANLAGHLQRFFADRLLGQLAASPHTVASYRDTFRLLLKFASKHQRCQPSDLIIENLDVKLIGLFLKHLEHDRRNSVRSRNNRLSAIHAFFGYVCLNEPALARHCQRVLAMPFKKFERGPVEFLTSEEITALLNVPDTATWLGRRDQLLLQVAVQTGLRNSELTGLRRQDVQLGSGAHVRCLGKGRKARCTPLRSDVVKRLSQWFAERPTEPTAPVFPTAKGTAMSADALQRLVARHIKAASKICPSLQTKRVTPHTLRHSTAMDLLQRGVDITVIALWLGHEAIQTTQIYLHADMAMKERALARATKSKVPPKR
ncbi:MAG TPA: tyrosine-type recombinase/integrase, partial [Clostridia bacterium]|nr:tyrosine-type recombinase/integrase [Clostridia bacterium]